MKSNELFKQILDGKIKKKKKIKVINEFTEKQISTIEYKNGRLNWVSGNFDTTFLCSSDIEFVIEKNIEELYFIITSNSKDDYQQEQLRNQQKLQYDKINELVRAVNKLNKEKD